MDVGGGGRDGLHSQSGVTRVPEWVKFTNLNVGGWESTTLEEVKEAVLPTTPASPEHLQLNYEIMNARFTRLEMDIWQPLYDW
ncbi:hypothetical protein CesoFtcFv8_017106 [Champsocephalus esox]|uniref:Uncharacterized protein n=1 Tax=Champsocephalus esox TaxID=159716 RepID=A0AAN8GPX4_9TELE|nr:hypothetical protein CesoFtcFv8_017106 [Champsocephalus esox]